MHDVINKILSRDSNYIGDVVMWPKFSNCSISMDLTRKHAFLSGGLGSSSIIWDCH